MSDNSPAPDATEHAVRQVALKIDVDTLRGTLEGVPRLLELLMRMQAGATFYFSVGPDHTGRALRRVFRRGFLSKVRRTSVLEHYGLRTLLYGTLLPGPHIGKYAAVVMRSVRDAGFEVGLHSYDHVRWQDGVAAADESWTDTEFERGVTAFASVFGHPPESHAAAGWQINARVLALESRYRLRYASDTRGATPFLPQMHGVVSECVQLPTTLPTLDELIGLDGNTADDAVEAILTATRTRPSMSHVFTLHAELEGQRLIPQFERLLEGWKSQGLKLVAMRELLDHLEAQRLRRHEIDLDEVPGRSGTLAIQGRWLVEGVGS
jgi:peptidoglycan/xylan/chitin deacetylase (PgdA/CDA1 family)